MIFAIYYRSLRASGCVVEMIPGHREGFEFVCSNEQDFSGRLFPMGHYPYYSGRNRLFPGSSRINRLRHLAPFTKDDDQWEKPT